MFYTTISLSIIGYSDDVLNIFVVKIGLSVFRDKFSATISQDALWVTKFLFNLLANKPAYEFAIMRKDSLCKGPTSAKINCSYNKALSLIVRGH